MGEESGGRKFQFLRNGDAEPSDFDWSKGIESARQVISEAMSAKNIAFLLGAGCSSLMKGGKELGISTMAPLAKEFCGEPLDARAAGFYAVPPVVDGVPAPWRLYNKLCPKLLRRLPAGITRVKSGGINQGGYCAH